MEAASNLCVLTVISADRVRLRSSLAMGDRRVRSAEEETETELEAVSEKGRSRDIDSSEFRKEEDQF